MAHIRLTFQKPDETEVYEISGEDGDTPILGLSPKNRSPLCTVKAAPTIQSNKKIYPTEPRLGLRLHSEGSEWKKLGFSQRIVFFVTYISSTLYFLLPYYFAPSINTNLLINNRTIASLFHEPVANEPETSKANSLPSRRGSTLTATPNPPSSNVQPRKFSFPTALPSGLLGLEPSGMGLLARRRFSNVSDAVTRKLSHTIGWRSGLAQSREIVAVGKCLCSQYIRSRLKRSGYLNRKCGLQRLRSAVRLPCGVVFREVYPELQSLGIELERLHPKLYLNVTRQASAAPGGRLSSEKEAGAILTAVSRELLKNELTWGKVVSLYAVAGGLAVDCARQGHYDYLPSIIEAMEEILEEELAHWIQYTGGWCALSALVRSPSSKWPSAKIFILTFSFLVVAFLIVFTLGLFGISAFF